MRQKEKPGCKKRLWLTPPAAQKLERPFIMSHFIAKAAGFLH